MLRSNGAIGPVGHDGYLELWRAEEILQANHDYGVSRHAPGFLILGSDGGGEGVAVTMSEGHPMLGWLPFIGMHPQSFLPRGRTLVEFLTAPF